MQKNEEKQKKEKKPKRRGNKILISIIALLLLVIFGGVYFVYHDLQKQDTPKTHQEKVSTNDDDVIKDYEFKNGKAVHVKAPRLGMAIKSAIQGSPDGHAEMIIKNSGDVEIQPQVLYNDKVIYTAPLLKKNEAVNAKLEFGKLEKGDHEFNVLGLYNGGSGLSLKSKVIVTE